MSSKHQYDKVANASNLALVLLVDKTIVADNLIFKSSNSVPKKKYCLATQNKNAFYYRFRVDIKNYISATKLYVEILPMYHRIYFIKVLEQPKLEILDVRYCADDQVSEDILMRILNSTQYGISVFKRLILDYVDIGKHIIDKNGLTLT